MQINRENLSRQYAALSDEELLAIDPNELTELALKCYDHEIDRRQLQPQPEPDSSAPVEDGPIDAPLVESHDDVEPDWLDSAATACSFQVGTGRRYVEDAEQACAILRDAGVPGQVVSEHEDGAPDLINVMVPGALSLKATSVLDVQMFNAEMEETWRSHFDLLSDAELRALQPDTICAGLLDRAARLRAAYEAAWARRKSEAR